MGAGHSPVATTEVLCFATTGRDVAGLLFFFFKQKTAYEIGWCDWSSDVCSSDLALHALGVKAISLSGPQAGITTDGRYGKARIASIEPERVRRELDEGKVVIVAGFQGRAGTGEGGDVAGADITTLGRGGSDTTAVALAARLGADRCQIFTDVRGIYTADPRLAPAARQLG